MNFEPEGYPASGYIFNATARRIAFAAAPRDRDD